MTKSISFLAGLLLMSACTLPEAGQANVPVQERVQQTQPVFAEVTDAGSTTINTRQVAVAVSALPVSSLSEAEHNGLIFMREEEKLAYDVYTALAKIGSDSRFQNISKSEASHTESVRVLLERYGLDDPNLTHTAGVYANEDLQKAYDAFIVRGEQSLVEALKVGAEIEELDIMDLRRLLEDVQSEDIRLVYNELLRGSRNHLRAFMKGITQNGATYTAVHLTQTEFDAIAQGAMERGANAGSASVDGSGNGPGNGPGRARQR